MCAVTTTVQPRWIWPLWTASLFTSVPSLFCSIFSLNVMVASVWAYCTCICQRWVNRLGHPYSWHHILFMDCIKPLKSISVDHKHNELINSDNNYNIWYVHVAYPLMHKFTGVLIMLRTRMLHIYITCNVVGRNQATELLVHAYSGVNKDHL